MKYVNLNLPLKVEERVHYPPTYMDHESQRNVFLKRSELLVGEERGAYEHPHDTFF